MPAQIVQMMTFTQIMDIWTPAGITVWDHLKLSLIDLLVNQARSEIEEVIRMCCSFNFFLPIIEPCHISVSR